MEDQSQFESFELQLNTTSLGFLRETAKWANFIAIMGFIGMGFMLLGAVAIAIMPTMSGAGMGMLGPMQGIMSAMYVILALLYFFPVYYLYKFASRMKLALNSKSTEELTGALENLKSHYKFLGIMIVVMIVMYILAIFGVIIAGIAH